MSLFYEIIALTNVELDKQLFLSNFIEDVNDKQLYLKPSGVEHYRLLAKVSQLVGSKVYDIGTYKGLSALALASYQNSFVISYDIDYNIKIERTHNLEFRIGNFYNDENILKSPFIFFDIDPHDGIQESEFYEYLIEKGYQGLVMFDDIHQFEGMRKFWSKVALPKYDLTHIGHWSGTGLVDFSH